MNLLTDSRDLQPALVGGCRPQRIVLDRLGFDTLYDAVHVDTGRRASIRLFALKADRDLMRRFDALVARRAAIEHPHLLRVHGASVWGNAPVLASDSQSMPSLGDRVKAGPLRPREAIKIFGEAAAALDCAADAGMLDHELGMGSILLHRREGVKLGDLGLAWSLARDLQPWGQPYPGHLSPEVARGERLLRPSNVYSLASILFDALTGGQPFRGGVVRVVEAHAWEPPPSATDRNPDLPAPIDAFFRRAMSKSPEERPLTASAMVAEAAQALGLAPGHLGREKTARRAFAVRER